MRPTDLPHRPDATPRYDPVPEGGSALAPHILATGFGTLPTVSETTAVAGLVLTPAVTGDPEYGTPFRFFGAWCLTHAPSGLQVSPPAGLVYTREAAMWLATHGAGVDWTRDYETIRADVAARVLFFDLRTALENAAAARGPLCYARTSWVAWPPLWRIWHGTVPTEAAYHRFESAASLAELATTAPVQPEDWITPDAVIRRDTESPGWGLRCASALCPEKDAWLTDALDGYHGPYLASRADVATVASVDGWVEHDPEHWTCPDCTRHYR